MKTIIHDFDKKKINLKMKDNYKLINANDCTNSCIGCFSCWIKHPIKCIYNDDFSNLVDYIKNSDELILISKCRYGCYSSEVKRVFERCIGFVLPYFEQRQGMIHHMSRYNNSIKLKVYFYGDINEYDRKCCCELVRANAINLDTDNFEVNFFKDYKEIEKCIH